MGQPSATPASCARKGATYDAANEACVFADQVVSTTLDDDSDDWLEQSDPIDWEAKCTQQGLAYVPGVQGCVYAARDLPANKICTVGGACEAFDIGRHAKDGDNMLTIVPSSGKVCANTPRVLYEGALWEYDGEQTTNRGNECVYRRVN